MKFPEQKPQTKTEKTTEMEMNESLQTEQFHTIALKSIPLLLNTNDGSLRLKIKCIQHSIWLRFP